MILSTFLIYSYNKIYRHLQCEGLSKVLTNDEKGTIINIYNSYKEFKVRIAKNRKGEGIECIEGGFRNRQGYSGESEV